MIDAQRRLGVPVTGRLDEDTYLAVRRYQLEHGLLCTGRLDLETYALLRETNLLTP